jgi:hypothetical protein
MSHEHSFLSFHWLGSFFKDLFTKKVDAGEINIADAIDKGITVVENIRPYYSMLKPAVELVFSDNVAASMEQVEGIIDEYEAKLKEVKTIGDLPATVDEIKFADDPVRNKFFHELFAKCAVAISDKTVSLTEGSDILLTIAAFVKTTK